MLEGRIYGGRFRASSLVRAGAHVETLRRTDLRTSAEVIIKALPASSVTRNTVERLEHAAAVLSGGVSPFLAPLLEVLQVGRTITRALTAQAVGDFRQQGPRASLHRWRLSALRGLRQRQRLPLRSPGRRSLHRPDRDAGAGDLALQLETAAGRGTRILVRLPFATASA